MVTNVTSLTGNGFKDWLIQRMSAVYFLAYSLFLAMFFIYHAPLEFGAWQMLFSCIYFEIATVIAVVALSLHAWIGLWTVTTDYLKCSCMRLAVQMFILLWLLAQFIWVIMIVWGR